MYKVIIEYTVRKVRREEQIYETNQQAQEAWNKLHQAWNNETTIVFPENQKTWRIISCNAINNIWVEKVVD